MPSQVKRPGLFDMHGIVWIDAMINKAFLVFFCGETFVNFQPQFLRSASRWLTSVDSDDDIGFRSARTP